MRCTHRLLLTLLFTALGVSFLTPVYAHDDASKKTVIVHITKTGFEPKTITITVGTEVVFENVDEAEHWPASDNHPSHTLYSGTSLKEHCQDKTTPTFDSCAGIQAGKSWSFIFNTPGTHPYHDHLWSHLTGEITVTEIEKSETILTKIEDYLRALFSFLINFFHKEPPVEILSLPNPTSDFYQTTVHHYKTITIEKDPKVAIDHLQEDGRTSNQVAAICHDALHVIGKTAYEKYGSFDAAIPFQSDFCNSGYIHGLFEAYFTSQNASTTNVATICDSYGTDKTPFHAWQCYHGIGHGFMYYTGGDLDASLALCETNFSGKNRSSCFNGVYMEIFNAEIVGKETSFVDAQNPLSVCETRATAKSDCYLYAPSYFSQTLSWQFPDIIEECTTVEVGQRSTCIAGVSTEAMKRNMNDPQSVFHLCEELKTTSDQAACAEGAATVYLFQTGSLEAGTELCTSLRADFAEICTATVAGNRDFFGQK